MACAKQFPRNIRCSESLQMLLNKAQAFGTKLEAERPNGSSVFSLLFVLPVKGTSGGANSVIQESMGLSRLGIDVNIAIVGSLYNEFLANYSELQNSRVKLLEYGDINALRSHISNHDLVCATTNASVYAIKECIDRLPSEERPRIAYYVQDYEPLFYPVDSKEWVRAISSYTAIPDATLFAKSNWIRNIVYENAGVKVAAVSPSVDHEIFFPDFDRRPSHLAVSAMLRPRTPRRAPFRTARVMEYLSEIYGDAIDLKVFGSEEEDLKVAGINLSPKIDRMGIQRRWEVPHILRTSDLFLDLSDYQAFGRTALESMACGCIPIVPLLGGAQDFAINGYNAYLVDTRADDCILGAVSEFLGLGADARMAMRMNALETAAQYTVRKAVLSQVRLFQNLLESTN